MNSSCLNITASAEKEHGTTATAITSQHQQSSITATRRSLNTLDVWVSHSSWQTNGSTYHPTDADTLARLGSRRMEPHTHTHTRLQEKAAMLWETRRARHNRAQEIPAGDADKRRIWKLKGGSPPGKTPRDYSTAAWSPLMSYISEWMWDMMEEGDLWWYQPEPCPLSIVK